MTMAYVNNNPNPTLDFTELLAVCRGAEFARHGDGPMSTATFVFTTLDRARLFAEVMTVRGWAFGTITTIPRRFLPNHPYTLCGGPL